MGSTLCQILNRKNSIKDFLMKNRTLALVTALFVAITPVVAGITSNGSNLVKTEQTDYCGVTNMQIYEYILKNTGEITNSITPITGSCNVIVGTTLGHHFTVYIENGIIIGHDDSDF
jgi:hypothetical protein